MITEFKAGLLGWPVSHSLSPIIHSMFLDCFGIRGVYNLYPVKSDNFAGLVSELCLNEFAGLNVTVPYKKLALKSCDTVSLSAQKAGAVNTLVFEKNKISGFNTDIIGIEKMMNNLPSPFYVLGNGGAAAAVITALGVENVIILRRGETLPSIKPSMATVVNATPLGWKNNDVFPFSIPTRWNFVDLNYNASWNWRNSLAVPVITGQVMLIEQAAEAFRLWTGYTVDNRLKTKVLERIKL